MSIGARLELRQGQTLAMTTQLQQSIKLLQLSALELSEFIESECEQNPLLTRDDGVGEETASEYPEAQEEKAVQAHNPNEDLVEFGKNHTSWDENTTGALDVERGAFWDDAEGGAYTPSAGSHAKGNTPEDGEGRTAEASYSESPSLQDHLREQLQHSVSDPAQRIIGLHLIDMVDERGYLPEDLTPVSEALHCTQNEVQAVLIQLQRFEPSGVCARNLVECLSLQLQEQDRFDPAMEKMLAHLDLLTTGESKKLAKLCGMEEEDIPLMLAEIRGLNPKPGYAFGTDTVQSVIPDVYLRKSNDGGWLVELNPDALPRVLLNRQYYTRISQTARRKEDKKYLSDLLTHANWLTKSLDQRAQTILKVATEIVRQQDAFFRHGVRYFKPLVLRDIAEAVEVHESTVSRVTTQKYLSTGSAIYELKYFFSSAVGGTDGDEQHSSESVKHMIRELINSEDAKAVLSDDAIAEKLQDQGIDIARRTVAKYREAMGIGSSAERRRAKKGML